jgi:hypothetical protein
MNVNHYLKKDEAKALAANDCSMDLLIRISDALYADNLDEVQLCLKDLGNSVGELTRLKERKRNYDRLVKTTKNLVNKGVLASTVSRRLG